MEEREFLTKIFYFCRERYYHAMQTTALEALKRKSNDPVFRLYTGLSLVLSKRVQEGIRELDSLQNDSEVVLGAVLALIFAHRRCTSVDREALLQLDSKLKEERKKGGEISFYHAAVILLHSGRPDKAREYVDKLLKINHESPDGLVLKGWIEIAAGKEGKIQDAVQYFDSAIQFLNGRRNLDAMLGKARYCELQNDYESAINILNQLIVHFPSLTIPLIEKMKNQLALLDWDQAIETANRILSLDSHCLEAQKAKVLTNMCRDGNYEEAALNIRRYYSEMERIEPKNADLFLESAQLFSRICGRDSLILAETYRFAEKAAQIDPTNVDFITELGYQCFLQGRLKDAAKYYRNATKIDESSVSALLGFTRCQLSDQGARDQATQQVEFLREVQGKQLSPDLLLMSAQLVSDNTEKSISYLNDAVETHFRALRALPYGPKYLKNLDPDFLLQIVKEYLAHAPIQNSTQSQNNSFLQGRPLPAPLKQSLTILEAVSKACPGLLEGLHQLARVQFLSGDLKGAVSTLQHILNDIDATCADANLLMAQIHIQQGNYHLAEQRLEVGLSFNFKVRDHPLYHFITALIKKHQSHMNECIQSLKTALSLSGMDTSSGSQSKSPTTSELSLPDRVSLFLEMADVYRLTNQAHEASKVMQDAIDRFHNTSEEGRVSVANAELALHQHDTALALDILKNIKPTQPYYQQARFKMADIYLHYRKDKTGFAECFRELVDNAPGAQSYIMLGDAYISIQEPDRAIEAYEQALKRNPRDSSLACKMGKALIKTHQYGKAINYYKEAIKSDDSSTLKLDMSELYMKLGQFDKAEKVLLQELEGKNDTTDVQVLIARTKQLLLLAKVREKSGNTQAALTTLHESRNNQNRVLKRMAVDTSSNDDQKQVAAHICQQMAEHASTLRDYNAAIQHYKDALVYKPDCKQLMVALAKLYMQVNDLEQCEMTCKLLLKTDSENEAASIMMADLAFRKVDFETAALYFQQLLSRRPNYWTALARLVEVMRRTGNLKEVPPYLARGEAVCARSTQEAGLSYCQGLYEWYSGRANEALRQFNNARRDQEWGQQSIYNMIEICLNPDDETLGSEAFLDNDDSFIRDSREMALRTAERLLKELKPRPGGGGDEALNHRLLANFLLLATRQKHNVERALQEFTTLASMDAYRDHVGTALGLATGYMMLKQTPRARNQLKRVAKNIWNFEDAEYLERCWLLLADIYIQNGKYDMASELLKRVLQHNKGCTRAYEYAGFVAEKEQSYREAAMQYEKAWRFGGNSNPAIGYKLAFNYMKGKRYADAIDVCQQVLKVQPDYPRIRKEILDKCRNNIRT